MDNQFSNNNKERIISHIKNDHCIDSKVKENPKAEINALDQIS